MPMQGSQLREAYEPGARPGEPSARTPWNRVLGDGAVLGDGGGGTPRVEHLCVPPAGVAKVLPNSTCAFGAPAGCDREHRGRESLVISWRSRFRWSAGRKFLPLSDE